MPCTFESVADQQLVFPWWRAVAFAAYDGARETDGARLGAPGGAVPLAHHASTSPGLQPRLTFTTHAADGDGDGAYVVGAGVVALGSDAPPDAHAAHSATESARTAAPCRGGSSGRRRMCVDGGVLASGDEQIMEQMIQGQPVARVARDGVSDPFRIPRAGGLERPRPNHDGACPGLNIFASFFVWRPRGLLPQGTPTTGS